MSQSRQLAAIMFTDIVGYTALMGDDEQKAFELLNKNRQLQKPLIEKYGGKWIKELGDGVLASFSTVTDAVYCACQIMKGCDNIEGLKLRIGIHLGEVLFENDDVFGDGVNIASRLQALAPIGNIWVSESVYKNVSNRKDIYTKFVREEVLKHVKEPVPIYEIITGVSVGPVNLKGKEPSERKVEKSIAVLPFTDMSPAHDQEYLGDGLAEELITQMSQIKELKVIGRTSSFSFKGTKTDLKTIGNTLNVNTILEGSVQKSANRLRITAQLINTADGCHIWSERYDREMDDIFALQDDICSKISEHLKLTLLRDHETAIEKRPTNLEAYEMFLKGEFYFKKYSAQGFEKAIEYFKKAVKLDPDYADAWWFLGFVNYEKQVWLLVQDKEDIETARSCAKKAIAIDESNANAHFLLAQIAFNGDMDWEKAGAEILIGNKYNRKKDFLFLPLEPWYRAMLYGDFNFAVREIQKGVEMDPLAILRILLLALIHLHGARDYKSARNILSRILELDPYFSEVPRYICLSWLFDGNYELALEYARKYYDSSEGKGHGAANLIMCLAASGKKEEAQQLYALVKKTLPFSQFPASLHVKANAYLDKFDEAFEYLDKAIIEKDLWLFTLKYSPEWDLLRPDPRFQKVLERMNFPK